MGINLPLVTNRVTTWDALKGKPYITVSAKGISNGQSTILNDGADFGPDTMLGATSNDQYGPPYTQSTGIYEAWNYAFSTATLNTNTTVGNGPNYWMQPIHLLEGVFTVNQKIFLSPSKRIVNPKMIGLGSMSTYVYWNFDDNCIEVDHTNGNIIYSNIEIGHMQPMAGSNVGAGTAFFTANYVSGDPSYGKNIFQSYDLDFSNTFPGLAALSLTGFWNIILYNIEAYNGGVYGGLYTENTNTVQILGSIMMNNPNSFYANNVNSLEIYGSQGSNGGVLSNVNYAYIDSLVVGRYLTLNDNINYLHIGYVTNTDSINLLSAITSSSTATVDKLKIDYLNVIPNTFIGFVETGSITVNDISIDTINKGSGSTVSLPILSSTSGPTAGTVDMRFIKYSSSYKELIITFTGYENDTTTNQVINYPMPFTTFPVAIANNPGLNIGATLTTLIINTPDNTTTYNGFMILVGY